MKRYMITCTVLLSLLVTACDVEDKGNYEYNELNGVTIEGIESNYELMSKVDNLRITPEVTGSIDGENDDNYVYSWYLCSGGLEHEHTVISTERNLDWKVDLNPGNYNLYYQINDKATGLEWISSTYLTVTSTFTKGFLLYGEGQEGEARLDMIVMPVGQDTAVAEQVYDFGQPRYGANQMFFSGNYSAEAKYLYLQTEEEDIKVTSGTYFERIGEFNEFGVIETDAPHTEPMRIKDIFPHPAYSRYNSTTCRNYRNRGYITEDMIVMNGIMIYEIFTTPINRYSANSDDYFKPYPLAFVRGACAYYNAMPMFYDMDANCFVKPNSGYSTTVSHCQKLSDLESDPFPWDQSKVGRTLVYGENGYELNDGDCHALMKDKEGNYCIYSFQPAQNWGYWWYSPVKKGKYDIDLSVAVGFEQASHYAFSSNKAVIFYTIGSTLWAYDYSRQQIISLDLGAEITCMEPEYCSTGSLSDIIIATYDQANHKGTVRKLAIGGGTDALTIEEKPKEIWEVTMKVLDIDWKNVGDNAAERKDKEDE